MKLSTRTEFILVIACIFVISGIVLFLINPATQSFFNSTTQTFSLELVQGGGITGKYPNYVLPCSIKSTVIASYLEGGSDTIFSETDQFYSNIYSFVNQNNGKTINYFSIQPLLLCTVSSHIGSVQPVVSGSYQIYNVAYYTLNGKQYTTNLSSNTVTIDKTDIQSGKYIKLGQILSLPVSKMLSSIPTGVTSFKFATYIMPTLNFYIPDYEQRSIWTGEIDLTNFGIKVNGNTISVTNNQQPVLFGCTSTNSICTYPLSSNIHYKISYEDGTIQEGDSGKVLPKLIPNELFKQTSNQQTRMTDITFTVLVKDTTGLGVSVANEKLNIGGTVQVGDHLPFTMNTNDFSLTPINDINYGLVTVSLNPNALAQDIVSHFGQPVQNPQQTTILIKVDGSFDANYKGKTYNGIVSGLSWAIDTMYGNVGSFGTSTSDANGSGCADTNTVSGINPNGNSPSSGQSFNCVPSGTTGGSGSSTDSSSSGGTSNDQSSSSQNSNSFAGFVNGILADNTHDVTTVSSSGSSNGKSGFCPDATTTEQCITELTGATNSSQDLLSSPYIVIYAFIGILVLIIIIVLARR